MGRKTTNRAVERFTIAHRRAAVAQLYLRSVPQARIADQVGCSPTTVRRDIRALEEEWAEDARISVDRAKGRELMRLARIEREFWRGWERSKGLGAKAAGDPRYLNGILACTQERSKLCGLYPPKNQQVHISSGQPPEWAKRIDELSAEEIEDLDIYELERTLRTTK